MLSFLSIPKITTNKEPFIHFQILSMNEKFFWNY